MKNGMKTFLFLMVGLMSLYAVTAAPNGADTVTQVDSSRAPVDSTSDQSVPAMAGNVTQLEIIGTAITTSWQGFYGNVTGSLVLADAGGNNMYNWSLTSPSGEVYASRSNAVTWANIDCSSADNITAEESALGQNAADPDSVSNTYTSIGHPGFDVGSATVNNCPSTQAFNSGGTAGTGFWQVLLNDETNTVYATVLDAAPDTGFDGNDWDFELLVGENGKAGNEAATPYYFYVELQ